MSPLFIAPNLYTCMWSTNAKTQRRTRVTWCRRSPHSSIPHRCMCTSMCHIVKWSSLVLNPLPSVWCSAVSETDRLTKTDKNWQTDTGDRDGLWWCGELPPPLSSARELRLASYYRALLYIIVRAVGGVFRAIALHWPEGSAKETHISSPDEVAQNFLRLDVKKYKTGRGGGDCILLSDLHLSPPCCCSLSLKIVLEQEYTISCWFIPGFHGSYLVLHSSLYTITTMSSTSVKFEDYFLVKDCNREAHSFEKGRETYLIGESCFERQRCWRELSARKDTRAGLV